jgi:(p)ppGpp synthase/HD superfamily hydrolase
MNWFKAYIGAIELAAIGHRDQKRKFKDEPYIVHPLRVSEIVLDVTGNLELACAAVLHDTLEDTKITPNEIYETFGERITTLVESVTKVSILPKGEREEEYLKRFSTASDETVIIKLADRFDNVRDLYENLESTPPHFRTSYIKNTVGLLKTIPASALKNPFVFQLRTDIVRMLSEVREQSTLVETRG